MKKLFLYVSLIIISILHAQQKPNFWNEIQEFKKQNLQSPPPENAILLLGSSSFTMWKDVGNYFPDKTIINRGFGGSRLVDLNYYSEELLNPYHPKQIIIYCGENDIAYDKEKTTAKTTFKRFKKLYKTIRSKYPKIEVDYISMKRSPSREQFWPEMKKANAKIERFMTRKSNAEYIDIVTPMEDHNGNVRKDLFLDDMLHMKPNGYEIWAKTMKRYMK